MKLKSSVIAAIVFAPVIGGAAPLTIEAVNSVSLARSAQTLELTAADLAPLGAKDLNLVHIQDAAGNEILCQAIDLDGDALRKFDAVIFQADFAAGETKTFTATVGGKQLFKKEQYKAFGRFVRERFDDFTWENDRIAHRTYGKALETWEGEPLSSSTIDIWSKRTPRMVVNDWYLADDYHVDYGEGADFYSAGLSRGCGGNGLWAADKLWVSRNFIHSRVLANGPIRVLFELEYAPFEVNNVSVSETKRISLDAGHQFDHFQSIYKTFTRPGQTVELTPAVGLKKVAGEHVEANAAAGWLVKWEKMEKNAGNQGLAVITRPEDFVKHTEDALNQLVITQLDSNQTSDYWAGFCWDKDPAYPSAAAWTAHVDAFARSLASPVRVTVKPAQ
jgi:hypothetical protein